MRSSRTLPEEDAQAIDSLLSALSEKSKNYIGYPNNQLLDNEDMAPFLNFVINNIGDPFVGNAGLNTCEFELDVLNFFRQLFKLHERKYWGYVCRGGTEGNIYALYLARENLPGGIVYYSTNSHYSIRKAIKLLNMESRVVKSLPNGEIDYSELSQKIEANLSHPAIIFANIGTTMKGAIDSVEKCTEILDACGVTQRYIHCDAALFGTMLPFIDGAPELSFDLPINSITVSGHKFLGSPIPCGVVLTSKDQVRKVQGHIDYIGSYDSTIFGSRDGFSVLLLWKQIKRAGMNGLKAWVDHSLEMTEYTLDRLHQIDWPAWKNDFSNIIMIRRPNDFICRKWHLATEADQAHLILMPSSETDTVDRFIEDLISLSH